MTKPRKDTDYLFLSARIRSLEKDLLTSQRLEQLLQSPSVENCSQLLSDLGYAPIRDEASLQSSLKRQREAVFAELERFMPEKPPLCWRRPAAPSAATVCWTVPASRSCGSWRRKAAASTSRPMSAP